MTQPGNARDARRFGEADAASDAPDRRRLALVPGGILLAIAVLVTLDVVADARAGSPLGHLALELGVVAVALGGAGFLAWQLATTRRTARGLRRDLRAAEASLARFREESRDHLRGLGVAIDRQFERWALSPAEREVALLLLKGLSLKEIAELRATSERTARQQSLAVYRKAGLGGRAELAAFFLEDLLLPARPNDADAPVGVASARLRG
ncbi:MAG TPA: LuxR family transcriptional regulator [Anaeromyxobacteraceae bacterium]|nr:LuxR family transcriptional regulator [Anaeromyxobacteraceae bacterium]